MMGECIYNKLLSNQSNIEVQLNSIIGGLYIVNFTNGRNRFSKKIIIE
jgi:hypothetical protein